MDLIPLSGARVAGGRPRDGRRPGEVRGAGGRRAGQLAQETRPSESDHHFSSASRWACCWARFRCSTCRSPSKLGLAGGPLIVAILIGRFGTHFHLVTYTTMSANLMLREIGIALFLAAVGIGAGDGFIEAIADGGYRWIGYGFIITVVPLLIVAVVARKWLRMNYYTLMGLIAGSTTDPPRAGLCERHGRKRHARRGILDRLSRRDVSPRADGADIHSLRSVTNLIRIRP